MFHAEFAIINDQPAGFEGGYAGNGVAVVLRDGGQHVLTFLLHSSSGRGLCFGHSTGGSALGSLDSLCGSGLGVGYGLDRAGLGLLHGIQSALLAGANGIQRVSLCRFCRFLGALCPACGRLSFGRGLLCIQPAGLLLFNPLFLGPLISVLYGDSVGTVRANDVLSAHCYTTSKTPAPLSRRVISSAMLSAITRDSVPLLS